MAPALPQLEALLAWREANFMRSRQAPLVVASTLAALFIILFLILLTMTTAAERRSHILQDRMARVAPMVKTIQTAQTRAPGEMSGLTPLAAAQRISRDLGLERHLASVRPSQVAGGREAVLLIYESLNMPQIVSLMRGLTGTAGLSLYSASLTHRLDNAKLANLQLTLAR